jgi:hypothetical protein
VYRVRQFVDEDDEALLVEAIDGLAKRRELVRASLLVEADFAGR